jgi:hypothetical protein
MTDLVPITPNDYQFLKPYFTDQPHRLCVYGLPSILSWRTGEYYPCAAVVDDALVIGADFHTQKDKRHLILPIGDINRFPPEKLYDLALSTGFPAFWFVTPEYLDLYGEERIATRFDIRPQPEFADYIYLRRDLAGLAGRKYSKKRNLINQFRREYLVPGRVRTEALRSSHLEECREFLDIWCAEHDCGRDEETDLACERQAAIHAIEEVTRYDTKGLLLRIDGEVAAFGIGARLTADMGVLHFEKALASYKGLYQYFDCVCAATLFDNLTYINKESDMGVENLAKAKESYFPVMRVMSYSLTALPDVYG